MKKVLSLILLSGFAGFSYAMQENKLDSKLLKVCQQTDSLEVVRALIEKGANVDQKYGRRGVTILMDILFANPSSTKKDIKEIIELLLKKGIERYGKAWAKEYINTKTTDLNKRTALMIAAICDNHPDILGLFLKYGADINQTDDGGYTALMWAVNFEHNDIIALLLKEGAKLNLVTKMDKKKVFGLTKNENILNIVDECFKKRNAILKSIVKAINEKNYNSLKSNIVKINFRITKDYKDINGNNLLHLAVNAKDAKIFELIFGIMPNLF